MAKCCQRRNDCIIVREQNAQTQANHSPPLRIKGRHAGTYGVARGVNDAHGEDLKAGYAGVLLDDALDWKYRIAAKDFIRQWFFPRQNLTSIPETKELRRFHLGDEDVQAPLHEAVRKVRLTKRVTSHTFRHFFATHLLQANCDIRTIQTLLGHADIRTTMMYLHCIPSRTINEAKGPLDL